MHKVRFEDDEEGRKRYEMCYQAIALVPSNLQVPHTDWDDVVGLVKKLKSIGEEAPQRIGGQVLYDLVDGGGEILLERGEMKKLIDFIKLPIWRPLAIEEAQILLKWLEAVPKEKGSLRLDAKPESKRAARREAQA